MSNLILAKQVVSSMRLKPYANAFIAVGYIMGIALLFQFLERTRSNTPDTIFDPIGALSLLVFSAALMGFLFFYGPVSLLIEGKKEDAVVYFLKTLGTFGAAVAIIFVTISFV